MGQRVIKFPYKFDSNSKLKTVFEQSKKHLKRILVLLEVFLLPQVKKEFFFAIDPEKVHHK